MAPDTLSPPCAARYLVVHPETVIALDIAETVRELDPGAEIASAATLDAAFHAAARMPMPLTAIVGFDEGRYCGSRLAALLRGASCRVVLVGADDPAPDPDWEALPQPFGSDRLKVLLASAARCPDR
ncbi:MAG: hypothetical protein ACOY4T_09960 [Pseudomonadota bacterium]